MEFHDEICFEKLNNFAHNVEAFLALYFYKPEITTFCSLKASFETDFEDICNYFKDHEDEDLMTVIEEMKELKNAYVYLMTGLSWTKDGYCWPDCGNSYDELRKHLKEPVNKFIKIVSSELMKRKKTYEKQMKEINANLQEKEKRNILLQRDVEDLQAKTDELVKDNESLKAKINNLNKKMESEQSSRIEKANSKANVIVCDCNNLYENKYSIAKEEFAKYGWNEKVIEEWLLKIFMECFRETKKLAEISKTKVKNSFKDQLLQHPFSNDEREFPHLIEINISQMLQEKPNPSILENLSQKIFVRYADKLEQANTSKSFKDFIDEAVHVTWQMNTFSPPMCLSTAGKIFDDSKHIRMGGHGNQIKRFLWPCIYTSEQEYNKGEVLQRGYVIKGDC